jgi:protein required for attachment to host cells
MKTTWVVVADEAIARILQWNKDDKELEPVEELTDPAAHADGADLRRDAYGRRAGATTQSANTNTSSRQSSPANVTSSAGEAEQHLEAEDFAKRVATRLTEAFQQNRFEELRIVAAPRFLGLLRKAMGTQVAGVVTDELDKDLIHMDNREISQRLFPERMAGGGGAGGQ